VERDGAEDGLDESEVACLVHQVGFPGGQAVATLSTIVCSCAAVRRRVDRGMPR
jgi:hypothetical protein